MDLLVLWPSRLCARLSHELFLKQTMFRHSLVKFSRDFCYRKFSFSNFFTSFAMLNYFFLFSRIKNKFPSEIKI